MTHEVTSSVQKSTGELMLVIETGTKTGGVAVFRESEALYSSEGGAQGARSEDVLGLVAEALINTGRTIADVSRIVISAGPGSSTGLRIGQAIALGLAAACAATVETVSMFAAVARRSGLERAVVVLVSSRTFHSARAEEDSVVEMFPHGSLESFGRTAAEHFGGHPIVMTAADWRRLCERDGGLVDEMGDRVMIIGESPSALLGQYAVFNR